MSWKLFFAPIAAAIGLAAAPAQALPIIGGVTVVEPTIDLEGAGLGAAALGDGDVNEDGLFVFPITGGDTSTGLIEHDMSGVRLFALSDNGLFIDLENFLIDISDPANAFIFADISTSVDGFVTNAAVFSFDLTGVDPFDISMPSIELLITAAASELLVTFFGLGDDLDLLAGGQFGLAATSPQVVPIPGAIWLFVAGLGGLIAARRRGRQAA